MSGRVDVSAASLEAMLRRRAYRTEPADLPVAVFRVLDAAPDPARAWLPRPNLPAVLVPWPVGRGLVPVLLTAGLLLAMLVGTLAGAQVIRERLLNPVPQAPVRWTSAPDRWVLDPVPGTPASLVAATAGGGNGSIAPVSADEAWASDGEALWHFVGDSWAGPFVPELAERPPVADPTWPRIRNIAVVPDGTVWTALDIGLAQFRDGSWDLVVADEEIYALAIARDGTVWAGTNGGGYLNRIDARTGDVRIVFCGYPNGITAAADGSLFVHGTNWGIGHQLWVLRDGTCARLDPPWDGTSVWVDGVVADVGGGVLMVLREREGLPRNHRLVRFENGEWSVVQTLMPGGEAYSNLIVAVDPAGGAWKLAGDPVRIQRFDRTRWVDAVPPQGLGSYDLAMARDGTMWFAGESGIERLQPAWDDPSNAPPGS